MGRMGIMGYLDSPLKGFYEVLCAVADFSALEAVDVCEDAAESLDVGVPEC